MPFCFELSEAYADGTYQGLNTKKCSNSQYNIEEEQTKDFGAVFDGGTEKVCIKTRIDYGIIRDKLIKSHWMEFWA